MAAKCGFDTLYRGPRRTDAVPSSSPPSAAAAAQWLDGHNADIAAGRVLDVTEIYASSPLTPLIQAGIRQVPKSYDEDGAVSRWRPISDASGADRLVGANADVDPSCLMPVQVCSLADVGAAMHGVITAAAGEEVVMATYDFQDAYRSLSLRLDDLWHSTFSHEGRLYIDLRVSFGARAGGSWLCIISSLIARRVQRDCADPRVAVVAFVDDSGVFATRSLMPLADARFRHWANLVGLTINEKKYRPPLTRQLYLGIQWCTVTQRIYLPLDKLDALRSDLAAAAELERTSCRALSVLLSRCSWASQSVRVLASCLAPARALTRGRAMGDTIAFTDEGRDALRAAAAVLSASDGTSVVPRHVASLDAPAVVSDASSTGLGWICHATQRFCSEAWPADIATAVHINVKELAAAAAGICDAYATVAAAGDPSSAVLAYIDNTSALACVSSLSTSSIALAPGTCALATFAALHDFVPLAQYVQSAANEADNLSRLIIPPELSRYTRVRYTDQRLRQLVAGGIACLYPPSSFPERR
jgi:hypothetical protein